MDLDDQREIQVVTEEWGKENLVVVLGSSDPDGAELSAITVTSGDPTYAGPLAGVPLGLPVYHILEPEVRALIHPDVFEEEVGMMEMVLDVDRISDVLRQIRTAAGIE